MKIKVLFLFIIFNSYCFATPISNKKYDEVIKYLNHQITKILKDKNIPGSSVIIVDNNKVIWQKNFGQLGLHNTQAVTSETLFSIESDSKMLTAVGVLIAAQKDLVNLNIPIKKYLPKFEIHTRFLKDPLKKITLKNLLSHTAGLPHEAPVGNNFNPTSPSFEAHINSIQNVWLRYPVGQRYAYSNLGFDLAGYILQKQAKIPFEKFMEKDVLKPLQMISSTFSYERFEKKQNRAFGTIPGIKNVPSKIPMIPAGGLYTNAIDIGKFIQFQLNDGKVKSKQILKKKYLKMMRTVPYPKKGQKVGYGLGIESYKFGNSIIYNHNGEGFGFNSAVIWSLKYNFGLAILMNGYDNASLVEIMTHIFAILENKKEILINAVNIKDLPKTQKVSIAFLKKWIGNYVARGDTFIQILIKNKKFGIIKNKIFYPLSKLSNNEFYSEKEKKLYRFISPKEKLPKYIESVYDGKTWDYNDGPNDSPGANKKKWRNYIGKYKVLSYSNQNEIAIIKIKNGYLYYNDYRLKEYKSGLFFASNGDTLNFNKKFPIWNNGAVLEKFL